jgi:hypothetical protein
MRTLIDNDLALAISVLDFAGPLVKPRPVQACDRRIIEMARNNVADKGRLTIAVGTRQVELATTIHGAIAVVVSLAFE